MVAPSMWFVSAVSSTVSLGAEYTEISLMPTLTQFMVPPSADSTVTFTADACCAWSSRMISCCLARVSF